MKPEVKQYTAVVGGKEITFETGKLAGLAGGAVTLRIGDAMLFGAATMSQELREGIDFFPLSVDYEERMYAGGKIPGSFFRREGRPSDTAILTARLTDRPLRPLFPKDMRNEVQVIMYSFSADEDNPLDIQAINTASAAVAISDIPWDGPVGAVRIGYIDGKFVVNPTYAEIENSDLDLRVAGTADALLMVECGAQEVSEDTVVQALELAQQSILPIIDTIKQMAAEVGKPKTDYPSIKPDESIEGSVYDFAAGKIRDLLLKNPDKYTMQVSVKEIKNQTMEAIGGENLAEMKSDISEAFEKAYARVVRKRIMEEGVRPDGRAVTEIRPIWCEVGLSPRAHGSGLFTRGATQVLSLATLGTPRDAQELDDLAPDEKKRYMHHYNFPPFSTGEVKRLGGTSRREKGHGALAERALLPVIPSEKEFPYTIRVVSECMSSNGSTSMGSVCGSTLSLMDTGVPIKAPVSGIAMGLITEGSDYRILSDIQGLEDHLGDMDFKVAGTDAGITALQMDIKIKGITTEMMSKALTQAKEGRKHILDKMMEVISVPRPELKSHVPRITTIQIPVDKIGAIIGPGGKTIRAIQEETGASIDIAEDGTVFISTTDGEKEAMVREKISALTETPELGRIYTGKVVRVADFGAFVEILPGVDGLVHISQLDTERVNSVEDVVQNGDEITVMITNIDGGGKIRLSRRAVLEGWTLEEAQENDNGGKKSGSGSGSSGSGSRGPRRDRGDRGRTDNRRRS
ncbi:MAG: polyribonucleotide nucleotidyltransferase [Anaerolineales bacterium]|nr:polyribonucleotide nucleotidyltransferase [Anaerolineales bacterium]